MSDICICIPDAPSGQKPVQATVLLLNNEMKVKEYSYAGFLQFSGQITKRYTLNCNRPLDNYPVRFQATNESYRFPPASWPVIIQQIMYFNAGTGELIGFTLPV